MLNSPRTRALAALTIQNASIALLTRHSRTGTKDELYLPSVAVFLAEIVKAAISWVIVAREYQQQAAGKKDRPISLRDSLWRPVRDALFVQRHDLFLLAVPACIYAGQNNLLYVALSNLSASVYQVTYQLKILTTAIFSVFFFKRQYSPLQWVALCLLTVGVAIVQIPGGTQPSSKPEAVAQDKLAGFSAILVACISSAVAGCYFEYDRAVLKPARHTKTTQSSGSLALRNLQLAAVSLPFDLVGIFGPRFDRERVMRRGLLHGFGPLAVSVVLNQAVGGLLIAAVVKEADSVSKGFATSLAVIVSAIVSSCMTSTLPNAGFVLGASFVIAATSMFAIF